MSYKLRAKIITITTFTKSTIMELHWAWYSNGGFSCLHQHGPPQYGLCAHTLGELCLIFWKCDQKPVWELCNKERRVVPNQKDTQMMVGQGAW